MAQAGSNYEKNGGPKSRWIVPLTEVTFFCPEANIPIKISRLGLPT